jgi:hypothetical protein
MEKLSARMPVSTVSGRWTEGESGIGFWVGGSSPVTPITGQCPAESGSRKVQLLISRQRGRAADFVTVLCPYQGKLDLAVERQGDNFNIRHGGVLDVLTLPPDGTRPAVARRQLAPLSQP